MKIRPCTKNDLNQLTEIYIDCAYNSKTNILIRLGKIFIYYYHKICMENGNSIFIGAENENGKIIGFVSGNLSSKTHLLNIQKNKYKLLMASLPKIIFTPSLLLYLFKRYLSVKNRNNNFISNEGARWEFWGVSEKYRKTKAGFLLHQSMLAYCFLFGANELHLEVDSYLMAVAKFHQRSGGKVYKEITTPDGIKRFFIKYDNLSLRKFYEKLNQLKN